MGKLIKVVLGLVITVVVLIVAAVVILPMVFDPNEHKDEIVAMVKEHTGRDLAIADPLELTVFPWLGVETGGVTFGNAPGFGEEPFARVRRLGVRVRVLPLLSRKLEVDTLVLEGAELNLERNRQGVTNWDDLAGKKEAGEKAEKPEQRKEAGEGGAGLASVQIQGIQLDDTRISWRDARAGTHYVLDRVRLKTGTLSAGAAVPVEAGFTLSSSKPKVTVDLDMGATVAASNDYRKIELRGLTLTIDGKGEGLPKGGVTLKLGADIVADLAADTLKVANLDLSGPETRLSGGLEVAGLQTAPQLKGSLKLSETNVKQLAALFGADIQTADPKALTRVSATVTLAHEGDATRLEPLQITLDDTRATGYVRLLSTTGPVLRAKLDVDAIDLDRYLPPSQGPEEKSAPAAGENEKGAGDGSKEDPFAALRPLDLVAELKIGRLVVGKARMQQVVVKVTSKGGVLKVDPMAARLYEGKFDGRITLDARTSAPRLHAVESLTGIQVGPLLKDVAGQDRLLGKGDIYLDIRTIGLSGAEVKKSLSGKGRFIFADGAYKGVNIAKLIRNATGQGGTASQTGDTEERTDFTEMSGSFTANKGRISNPDLQAKSPLLRISGKGDIDLRRNTIDYLLTTEIVKSLEGQGGASADQLAGVPIPVRIKGPLDKPSYTPDLKALVSAKARQRIEKEKAKLRSKIEEKARGALGDKLKGLFGR